MSPGACRLVECTAGEVDSYYQKPGKNTSQTIERVRKMKRSSVVNRVRGPRRWFWIKRRISNRYVSNHRPPIHHRLRTKGPIPRFAGVLAPIGGNRTLDRSTSHLMCSPLGTSGNCTRIRKCAYNCENELTLEVMTKLATIPWVQEENWAMLQCPTLSCSSSAAWLPSSFAAACAFTKGVLGSAWQAKVSTSLIAESGSE